MCLNASGIILVTTLVTNRLFSSNFSSYWQNIISLPFFQKKCLNFHFPEYFLVTKHWNKVKVCQSSFITGNFPVSADLNLPMAFQVSPECLGSVEEIGLRARKDLWEPPVKGDLRALKGPKEVKGQWDHLERWARRKTRTTRANRGPQLWSLRGTGNSASGANWMMAGITAW